VQIKPTWIDEQLRTHLCVTWWQAGSSGSPISLASLQQIQTAVNTPFNTTYLAYLSNNWKYTGCIVTDYQSNTGLQATNSSFTPVTGTDSAGMCPAQSAVLISLYTRDRYRGGHGRIYWPGSTAERLNNSDFWGVAITGEITTIWNAIGSALGGIAAPLGPVTQVVLRNRRLTKPGGAYMDAAYAFQVQSKMATQRRRLRKAAHH
jgi:hypothetical protein